MGIKKAYEAVISILRKTPAPLTEEREQNVQEREEKLKFSFGNLQHIGKRETQQDAFGFSNTTDKEYIMQHGIIAVVADGMGGLAYGKEISEEAVRYMLAGFREGGRGSSIREQLLGQVYELNGYIHSKYQMQGGSTLIAVYIKENNLYWVSVGDSALYLKRENRLYQLNKEHIHYNTLCQKVFLGEISSNEAWENEDKHALTEYIGKDTLTEVDCNIWPFVLKQGDKLLVCSDGISGYLLESEIAKAMEGDIRMCCQEIEQLIVSKQHPYQDNFTGLMIYCE